MPKPPTELTVTPNPKLEKRTRRQFSTEYKLCILDDTNTLRRAPEFGRLFIIL